MKHDLLPNHFLRLVGMLLLAGTLLSFSRRASADTLLWNENNGGSAYTNYNAGWVQMKRTPLFSPPAQLGTIRVYYTVDSCRPDACNSAPHVCYSANASIRVEILRADGSLFSSNEWCCVPNSQITRSVDFGGWGGAQFSVRILAKSDQSPLCNADHENLYNDQVYYVLPAPPETISTSSKPSGPGTGALNAALQYTTGGSTSNLGHAVQYLFDWGDGTNSGWLALGKTNKNHAWAARGTYLIKSRARCATDTGVTSSYSVTKSVTIQ